MPDDQAMQKNSYYFLTDHLSLLPCLASLLEFVRHPGYTPFGRERPSNSLAAIDCYRRSTSTRRRMLLPHNR